MDAEQIKNLRILRQHIPADVMINLTEEGIEFKTNKFRDLVAFKVLRVMSQSDPTNFYKNVGERIMEQYNATRT